MPRTLTHHDPRHFKTQPLWVEATVDSLAYRGLGQPLNFEETLARRRPIEIDNPHEFSAELANLGVSVRITLQYEGRRYWLLVRQQRPDRGDTVLKYISGYVPAQELCLPLLSAVQEVAEECLIETSDGWLGGSFAGAWLPTPYSESLHYQQTTCFKLKTLSGAARPVTCNRQTLMERPRAYVHLPTASLQLVYDLQLDIPEECRDISLFHVDETLEDDKLVAMLDPAHPDIYLVACHDGLPSGELFLLQKGERIPVSTQDIWLSESFAPQDGWLVREPRVRWADWLAWLQAGKTA